MSLATALIVPILIGLLLTAYIAMMLLTGSARDALSESGGRRRAALGAIFLLVFFAKAWESWPMSLADFLFAAFMGLILVVAAAVGLSYRDTPDRVRRFAEKRGLSMTGTFRSLLPSFWELHGRLDDVEIEMFALTSRRHTVIVARACPAGTRRERLEARFRDLMGRESVDWVGGCAVATLHPIMVTEQELDRALELSLRELSLRRPEPARHSGRG